MRLFQTIGVLSLLSSLAFGVLFEDAFVKDWIKHTYGEIQQYEVLSDKQLIGLTNEAQILNIDISSGGKLNWKADLREYGNVDQYLLSKNRKSVYAFSTSDSRIYLFDTKTGILQETLTSETVPLKVVEFFGIGVLVVGTDGLLTFLGNDGVVKPISTDVKIKDIKTSQVDGTLYVITDELLLIRIAISLDVLSISKSLKKYISNIDQVETFKDNIVVTRDNVILSLDDNGVNEIENSLKLKLHLQVLNLELAYSINSKVINFYSIVDGKFSSLVDYSFEEPIEEVDFTNYASAECVLLATESDVILLDVSGLSLGSDINAIQKYQLKSNSLIKNGKNYINYDNESNLQLISSHLFDFKVDVLISVTSTKSVTHSSFELNRFHPTSSKYLMIDRPQSEGEINKVHHLLHDSDDYHFFISRWLAILRRHLSQLGRFIISKVITSSGSQDEYAPEDTFGFGKLIIFMDELQGYVIAIDSENGSVAWKSQIDANGQSIIDFVDKPATNEVVLVLKHSLLSFDIRNGKITSTRTFEDEILNSFLLRLENEEEVIALKLSKNSKLQLFKDNDINIKADQYLIDETTDCVQGYKINDRDLTPTWKFEKPNEKVLLIKTKPMHTKTSSIGITLSDKSVLYKYLNPNLISIITEEEDTKVLRYYLIDSVSGNILYTHEHSKDEVVDSDSIQLCMDDNWIVYTFFVKAPKLQQRIIVFDLFDTKEKSVKTANLVSAFESNTTINFISKKSFIFPERIVSLASTQTKFGITLKSMLFLTESGSLIEVPKFVLNSRRIANRELTSKDYQDDFRMMPYEPVIPKNNFQVLNHKHQLILDPDTNQILMKPTELESTSVVCFANKFNIFCNVVQPSLSYDLLSQNFDRIKLVLTILALLAAYLITKPFVFSRRLNAYWIDR
ncbi:uncharacterized protein AC631_04823 [Debaryomyces fabryi]|uniref:ER membrane protein complex subunit 1 n=1 Tax=Debaryomyces fabryi TaxID=58627 RepID=A0A0V1PT28_9ASCO|nr:uncharacterized protein AC631_04823 [Debaryomyces fabryi]KRZ99411.1 hypothetical protein AC631_04823 [Debaryomyces fabryi]CUM46182.1 unnamed protein product [Debaryomyces fabryi]